MTFDDISGNDLVIQRITAAASRGELPHACIIEGDARVDKPLVAKCIAKAVLCGASPGTGCATCDTCRKIDSGSYEDVLIAEADVKGEMGVRSVKDEKLDILQDDLRKKPFAGERKVAIIHEADTMTPRAQNRFLKTLEEPMPGTIILLLSDNAENLPQTIRSRCVVYRFNPFRSPAYADLMAEAEDLAHQWVNGAPFYTLKAKITALADERSNAYLLLDALEACLGQMLRNADTPADETKQAGVSRATRAIRAIEEARRAMRRNMATGYTLKHMILTMEE